jgi:hypothetical protein
VERERSGIERNASGIGVVGGIRPSTAEISSFTDPVASTSLNHVLKVNFHFVDKFSEGRVITVR